MASRSAFVSDLNAAATVKRRPASKVTMSTSRQEGARIVRLPPGRKRKASVDAESEGRRRRRDRKAAAANLIKLVRRLHMLGNVTKLPRSKASDVQRHLRVMHALRALPADLLVCVGCVDFLFRDPEVSFNMVSDILKQLGTRSSNRTQVAYKVATPGRLWKKGCRMQGVDADGAWSQAKSLLACPCRHQRSERFDCDVLGDAL